MDAFYKELTRKLELPDYQFVVSALLGVVVIFLTYWYSTRKHDYWKKRGVPYVKPLPLVGTILGSLSKPIHDDDREAYQKQGLIFGSFEGNTPVITVADPDLLRDILVKDFHIFSNRRNLSTGDPEFDNILSNLRNEDWKRVRAIISPTFSTGKIKRMVNIFKDCAETLMKNFRSIAEKGEPVDVKRMYGAYTMDVIASSAFSTKIDSHNDPDNEFVAHAKEVFISNNKWKLFLFLIMPSIFKLFKISLLPAKTMQFFREVTLQIIEQRKKTGETRNDFLQLLLDTSKEMAEEGKLDVSENASDDIAANYGKDESTQIFKTPVSKKNLSHSELVAQCIIFFIAGYETTAAALSYASYCMALNPDVQEKLINEVDEALGNTGGELTYEAIQKMKYLDNVISETLRMYPPGIRSERVGNEDYKLRGTDITIPKGMIVQTPVFAMHRDPKNYPNPEKFDPDRFSPEERAKRNPFIYLPFGAGPRNCVAMRFALMEVKVCLAHVLSQFRIKTCPETKVPLNFQLGQSLLQAKEVTLQIEIRNDKVQQL